MSTYIYSDPQAEQKVEGRCLLMEGKQNSETVVFNFLRRAQMRETEQRGQDKVIRVTVHWSSKRSSKRVSSVHLQLKGKREDKVEHAFG